MAWGRRGSVRRFQGEVPIAWTAAPAAGGDLAQAGRRVTDVCGSAVTFTQLRALKTSDGMQGRNALGDWFIAT